MLLECKHCGAPLDVEGDARLARCKYCGTTSRVKKLKTMAIETPPGWRPPTQWTPPPNAAADSAKTLVYHATYAVKSVVRTLVMLVVFFGVLPLVGIVVFMVIEKQQDSPQVQDALAMARSALDQAKQQVETASRAAGVPSPTEALGAAAGAGFLEGTGPDRVVETFREALGGGKVEARRVVMHPGHASLIARNPDSPDHFDEYRLRGSTVSEPEPYKLTGLEKRGIDKYLFELDGVAFHKIPELGQKALAELGYEQGAVSHVIVDRNVPFDEDVVIRVYVSSPRDSGRIDYDRNGKQLRVFR